jgi:XTP/dITP diphosphohydrolase
VAITLITGNQGKVAEFEALIGTELQSQKIPLTEIQALDVAEVAKHKAAEAYAAIGAPVLVDDTGFAIDAWQGLPGALITWFLQTVGNQGILQMAAQLPDRSVTVTTALGYADANGVQVFTGTVKGTLATEERGDNGFGYDAIFIPEGSDKTFAEMTSDEKNQISMRKLAADQLKASIQL